MSRSSETFGLLCHAVSGQIHGDKPAIQMSRSQLAARQNGCLATSRCSNAALISLWPDSGPSHAQSGGNFWYGLVTSSSRATCGDEPGFSHLISFCCASVSWWCSHLVKILHPLHSCLLET